jgi:ABC-type transporter Mla MlaB component
VFSIDTEENRLRLQCNLTIFQAGQLWPAISKAVKGGKVREIDLTEVGEFDSAGVQLLLMLKRVAAERKRPLHLVNHSAAVTDVLGLLNVAGLLGDPVVLPSQDKGAGL